VFLLVLELRVVEELGLLLERILAELQVQGELVIFGMEELGELVLLLHLLE
jgi:hypothetical protein